MTGVRTAKTAVRTSKPTELHVELSVRGRAPDVVRGSRVETDYIGHYHSSPSDYDGEQSCYEVTLDAIYSRRDVDAASEMSTQRRPGRS